MDGRRVGMGETERRVSLNFQGTSGCIATAPSAIKITSREHSHSIASDCPHLSSSGADTRRLVYRQPTRGLASEIPVCGGPLQLVAPVLAPFSLRYRQGNSQVSRRPPIKNAEPLIVAGTSNVEKRPPEQVERSYHSKVPIHPHLRHFSTPV